MVTVDKSLFWITTEVLSAAILVTCPKIMRVMEEGEAVGAGEAALEAEAVGVGVNDGDADGLILGVCASTAVLTSSETAKTKDARTRKNRSENLLLDFMFTSILFVLSCNLFLSGKPSFKLISIFGDSIRLNMQLS